MKLSPRTFKLEWDLHGWVGVCASFTLFVSFYCGVFALFHDALLVWQDPRNHAAPTTTTNELTPQTLARLVNATERSLEPAQGSSLTWQLRGQVASVALVEGDQTRQTTVAVSAPAGELALPEYSRLSDELYAMHFFYRLPGGVELAGLSAVALLVALVSGLLIHLKDLKRQLWRFRPQLRLRYSASDTHKVLGVFTLPFATLFGWSGAVLGLFHLLAVPFVQLVFAGDEAAFERVRGEVAIELDSGVPGHPKPVAPLLEEALRLAHAHWPQAADLTPTAVELSAYGTSTATLAVRFSTEPFRPVRAVVLDAERGTLARFEGDQASPGPAFERVLFDLHYAVFGGMLLKGLYALLALAVCGLVLTGTLIWLERRAAGSGSRLLQRALVGLSFGLMFASSSYFVANRLLPSGLEARANWELASFGLSWLVCLASVLVWARETRAWAGILAGGAAVQLFWVLLLDLVQQPTHLLSALARGHAQVFTANLLLVALATAQAYCAWKLLRRAAHASIPAEA